MCVLADADHLQLEVEVQQLAERAAHVGVITNDHPPQYAPAPALHQGRFAHAASAV